MLIIQFSLQRRPSPKRKTFMSQLSIKFGLVSLLAHASQVHGAPTCIGNGYLTNANFALSALKPNNQPHPTTKVMIYNATGQDDKGINRYVTYRNKNKEEMCYPVGATEMFALEGMQHNGIEIKFTKPMKKVTLEMRDFGDYNSAKMKDGKVIARAMNGNNEVSTIADSVVGFTVWSQGRDFWENKPELEKGDACTGSLEDPKETGKYQFKLESTGKETFDKVLILFESTTKDGHLDRELIDSNTSWGMLCYEEATLQIQVSTPMPTKLKKTAPAPPSSAPSCDLHGGYAYDNKKFCKCPAPVAAVAGVEQFEVSVCGDATYLLPENVQPCSGPASADPAGTGCPKKGDVSVKHCREDILSYMTGNKSGKCKAPEDATCEKLGSGAWGCVFPGNCNTVNTCMEKPTCEGEYERDAAGLCVLGDNGYPKRTENNTATINTDQLPALSDDSAASADAVTLKDSAASAVAVTSLALVATMAMTFIFA